MSQKATETVNKIKLPIRHWVENAAPSWVTSEIFCFERVSFVIEDSNAGGGNRELHNYI